MNQVSNIAKGILGNVPLEQQENRFGKLTWRNEKVLKHQEDVNEKTARLSGLNIHYIRPYELLHTYKDLFENQIYKFSSTTKTPLVIDCGANIGLSVLYFKSLYPAATIIAFEPDHTNFVLLEKNVNANAWSSVTIHKQAVWIHNDGIQFEASNSEASHISERASAASIPVKTVRLADLLRQHGTIDFLKIDIEGAEEAVLIDCAPDLVRVQNLFLEYHGKTGETKKLYELLQIIETAGFQTYIQNAADLLSHPFLNKTTGNLYDVQLNVFCFRAT
ncbi:MAG TPA: FkbM family methyltransferase [Chitinophagaceae bacterium]|nr:FkbM family methyltransferase [Chitinophagaceae bacterium]